MVGRRDRGGLVGHRWSTARFSTIGASAGCTGFPERFLRRTSVHRAASRVCFLQIPDCYMARDQPALWRCRRPVQAADTATRAFDEKVESMIIVDSHDGANQIQDPHWDKGASDEWGSLIPTICVNVSLRQSKPVIPVRKLLSCTTWL